MTGLKSIFITLLITSAFQLIGQVVTPPDARGSYWIAPENYYAVNTNASVMVNTNASRLVKADPAPLVSRECIGATAIYRVVGEAGSTYSWTIKDDAGTEVSWTSLVGSSFTETTSSPTIYGNETLVTWMFTGNYTLEVTQFSIHTCKTIKLGEVQVYPQPEVYVYPDATICPQGSFKFISATVTNTSSVKWIMPPGADGGFDDITLLNATYKPGLADISNGSVQLTLEAYGFGDTPGCTTATTTATLYIQNLEADVVTSTITCYGQSDGFIRLENRDKGTEPYKLYIEGNGISGWFNTDRYGGLGPGTYRVKIGDANGCERDLGFHTILEPDPLIADVGTFTPTCAGNDGKIIVSKPRNAASELVGVPGAYMYIIEKDNGIFTKVSDYFSGPTTDAYTFGGLATGTYTVSIYDVLNATCQREIARVTLIDPDPLFVAATASDVTCFGANDGTVSVTISTGGSGNYEYQLIVQNRTGLPLFPDWVKNIDLIGNIPPGSYTLQMTDGGCVVTDPVLYSIIEPEILAGTATSTDEKCWNAKDGTIEVTASSGGHKPYSYIYLLEGIPLDPLDGTTYSSGWVSTSLFNKLPPGTYDLWIGDAKFPDCKIQIGFSIVILPAEKLLAMVTLVAVKCNGDSDGEIVITNPVNGKAPYFFSKDNGDNWIEATTESTTITDLAAGTYTITMRDSNNCSNELDPVTITEPPKLIADYIHSTETIAGKDVGTVTVTSQEGGTPYSGVNPYRYSKDGVTWQTDPVFTNLDPGTYTITISDANDCEYDMTVTIRSVGLITAKFTLNNVTCNGENDGSITFYDFAGAASGKYEVSINNGLTWEKVTGATYPYNNLAYGIRDLVVREEGAAITESYLVRKLIDQPAKIQASVIMVQAETGVIKNGIVEVTSASGGVSGLFNSFVFRINGSAWQSNPRFTGLSKGDYTVDVMDSNSTWPGGCFISKPVKVVGEGELTASADVVQPLCDGQTGTITITAAGVRDIEYSIDGVNFYLKQFVFNVGAGDYMLVIRDFANKDNKIAIPGPSPSGAWRVTVPAKLILTSTDYEWPTCQTPYAKITVTGATRNGVPVSVTGDLGEHRLPIGEFKTYYVYDQNGCPAEQNFGSPAPPSITSSVTPTPALCYGGTGSIAFTIPNNGVAAYILIW